MDLNPENMVTMQPPSIDCGTVVDTAMAENGTIKSPGIGKLISIYIVMIVKVCVYVCPFFSLSQAVCLPVCLCVCLPINPFVCQSDTRRLFVSEINATPLWEWWGPPGGGGD